MCGIAGFWQPSPFQPEDADRILQKMTAMLFHRGPDGYGYHRDELRGLAMGHARLSIIDLETGNQPLFNESRQHVLTVNGEFYDYKRIRANLVMEGVRFVTKSDSEIALHLYRKHGLDFVHHLRGEFGFALYDGEEDRLILVRDRFGIKPVFYHIKDGRVFYGSEIKALLAHPDVPREFSEEGVLHQLMHTMVPGSSAFKDIHAVKPGHMLVLTRRGEGLDVREICYWDMDFPRQADRPGGYQPSGYYKEKVQSALLEAVQHRLEADVPVGCYLSGGIDSCSMLGLASSVQQSPVKAFTISFDNDAYDEAQIARLMAKRVNADQEIMHLNAGDLYGQNYLTTLWHAERTFYNTLGVAKWCMSRRVHECGYKVVVTGEGSDELFGGYPALKRDMLLHGQDHAADEAHTHRRSMDKSNELFKGAILSEVEVSHPDFERLCGFTPSWIQPWMLTLELARPLLQDDLQVRLKDYDPVAAIAASFDARQIEGRHALDIAQYTWIKTMLECQILNWGGDRVDMANAMESRPAFLDHHVAEVARDIPPTLRIKGGTEKWILREAMKNILPKELYEREKFAFMAPPGHTGSEKQQAFQQLIDEFLDDKHIQTVGLFDADRLRKFVREYETDKDPVSLVRKDALMNHILGLHILHQQYIQPHELMPRMAPALIPEQT